MRHLVLAASLIALVTLPTVAVAQQTESERRADELAREAERRRVDEEYWAAKERSDADFSAQKQRSAEAYQYQEEARKEVEAMRAKLIKQPHLPASKNPLLGRWVMTTKVPSSPDNLTDLIVNMQSNMETLVCAMWFGEREFEYRPDVLVLGDPGDEIVADRIAYRAGKSGSVFALGDKLIRLLLFEFDAGPDRMRSGKCIYQKVKAKGGASAPAPAAKARTYAGAGFKVAGATLGIDGTPAVYRDVAARGGILLGPGRGPLGPMRFYGRDARYEDVSADAYTVAYDFDSEDPTVARLTAVTLLYGLDKSIVAARAAALGDWNPQLVKPGRLEGRKGDVWLVLEELPADGSVGETYLLK